MANSKDFDLSSYDYKLPPELIASRPAVPRESAKLLIYHQPTNRMMEALVGDLPQILKQYFPSKLPRLVLNNSRVVPARILGHKFKGSAKVELLVASFTPNREGQISCLVKSNFTKKVGDIFELPAWSGHSVLATIESRDGEHQFWIRFNLPNGLELMTYFEQQAMVPIPSYLGRAQSDDQDRQDYQTFFAKHPGAVAAPTAGLHFTASLLQQLDQLQVPRSEVTLHVGPGTFRPVQVEDIRLHQIHREEYFVPAAVAQDLWHDRDHLLAVGTTSLRVLESYRRQYWPLRLGDRAVEYRGSTELYLYPGQEVLPLKGLWTNFHLPKSTLLMLLGSLLPREKVLELYHFAIEKKYRFYSYGDACLFLF